MNKIPCALLMAAALVAVVGAQTSIKLGAIYSDTWKLLGSVTRFAVDTINKDTSILPNHQISLVLNTTGQLAAYESIQAVCYQLGEGVMTIIGPGTSTNVKASYPMALGVQVPVIPPSASDPKLSDDRAAYRYLLRMTPPDSKQSLALVDFIQYFRFDTMAILTDNTDYGVNGLLAFQSKAAELKWRVLSVQQFVATNNASNVNAVTQLRQIKGTGARIIILNCLSRHALVVLEQAEREGMMQEGWLWIGTDGITGTNSFPEALKKKPYLKGFVGTRPVAGRGALATSFFTRWKAADPNVYYGAGNTGGISSFALSFYDAVLTFAHAMHQILEVEKKTLVREKFDCYQVPAKQWPNGSAVYDTFLKSSFEGVTKKIAFRSNGEPLLAEYDIVVLEDTGWEVFGEWKENMPFQLNYTNRLTIGGLPLPEIRDYVGDLHNKTLRIVTIVDPPFVYHEKPPNGTKDGCTGNGCFSGIIIDLLNLLRDDLKFNFELYLSPDGTYGTLKEGKWSGMVGELINKKADLAAAAFTITYDREQVVSFTKPFRDLQLGLAIGTPETTYNPWSFLVPLTNQLWLYILLMTVAVAFVLSLTDKLSPYGHHGKKAVLESDEEDVVDINEDGKIDEWEYQAYIKEKHEMSVPNALFWSFASFLQQGGEVHPKSWSGRIAAAAWWLGTLIITATYTANLAAFLTIKTSTNAINSVEDLYVSKDIHYSTVANAQPQVFFDTAIREPYKTMGARMRSWDDYFDNASEAVQYTVDKGGRFAFIFDMPMLEYWKGQRCKLQVLQSGFGNVGYGLAVPKGAIYAEELSIRILLYRESGKFDELEDKWVTKRSNCTSGSSPQIGGDTVKITMASIWGIFWIIAGGFVLALVVLVLEWIWASAADVKPDDPKKPKTFKESFQRRWKRLETDFKSNWFKIKWICKDPPKPSPFRRQTPIGLRAQSPR